jgi:hypothetical protein
MANGTRFNKNILKKAEEIVVDNRRVDNLYKNIADHIHAARNKVLCTVNTEQVKAYWLIGRDIVEEEQTGKERAQYGAFLLQEISLRLTKEFGGGFGISTLKDIRKFYWLYKNIPIGHAVCGQSVPEFKFNLGWTHYRALMRDGRAEARSFYELEA